MSDEGAEGLRKVLIVAYYFPPLGGIGSVRMSGFARYLPEYGWSPIVLAPASAAYHVDPDMSFPEDQVLRSGSLEISRMGKQVLRTGGSEIVAARPSGIRRVIQSAVRRYLYFPDGQIGWYWPALKVGRAAMRRHKFDAIYSSAFPVTGHLIARRLHRDTGVPWVAEFRDPFSDLVDTGALNRRRAAHLERSIAHEAAGVVMTSPSWSRAHAERWSRPVTAITNGYDEVVRADPPRSDEFVLTHLGSLYPQWQDLAGLWQAILRLEQAGQPTVDRLCFVGAPQPEVREELDAYGLMPRVEITGLLAHREAAGRLRRSGALLLAGPKDGRPELRGWSSGKMFEYLATDLPIIFVGDRDTDAAHLLEQYAGCYVVDSQDVEGLMAALRGARGERHVRDVSSLSRRTLTGKLAALLDEAARAQ
jgi:glycosyltransferase involved in cell wall biosynthesis